MSVVRRLYEEVPGIQEAMSSVDWIDDREALWTWLRRFIDSPSPTVSVSLPGTVTDALAEAAAEAGFGNRFHRDFNGTGNAAILLGKQKDHVDLLVDSHLDKPCFGVATVVEPNARAELFACCANRYPEGEYRIEAKVIRYDESRQVVGVCGRGHILSHRKGGEESLVYEAAEGEIDYTDIVAMDVPARMEADGTVIGSGFDDGAGVAVTLGTARVLKELEPLLEERSLNCLFTFSDNEEWPPTTIFSLGASKTTFSMEAPTYGSIVVDVHNAGKGYRVVPGKGIGCGFVSSRGRGAALPLNYQRLTSTLIEDMNGRHPHTVQHNTGYFSRSDDFTLMRWSRILGLLGMPAHNIHLGNEIGHIADVQGGIRFLGHYVPVVLCLSASLTERYHLAVDASYPLNPGR